MNQRNLKRIYKSSNEMPSRRSFLKQAGLLATGPLMFGLSAGRDVRAVKDTANRSDMYRVEEQDGRPWLITPDGKPLFLLGINHIGAVRQLLSRQLYNNEHQLSQSVIANLRNWGFNSAGYGAFLRDVEAAFPHLASIQLTRCKHFFQAGQFDYDDVFDPAFHKLIEQRVQAVCKRHRGLPTLLGYNWTDTPRWDLDIARAERVVDWVTWMRRLPGEAPGKRRYIEFLRDRYDDDAAAFGRAYQMRDVDFESLPDNSFHGLEVSRPAVRRDDEQFLSLIAEELYRRTKEECEKHDPGRLIFGERYKMHDHPEGVLSVASRYVDVISIQPGPELGTLGGPGRDETVFDEAYWLDLHKQTGKPLLVVDHAVSFYTPQRPVTLWHQFPNQEEAAKAYRSYLEQVASCPLILGYLRCQYLSEYNPLLGLLKQGLLDEEGRPFEQLTAGIRKANRAVLAALGQAPS